MPKILIIDDDTLILNLLTDKLNSSGFFVSKALNTLEADKILLKDVFDLIIVDYMIPGENGKEWLEKFRKRDNNTPVIMLTAISAMENKLDAFEKGVTDYIAKPFNSKELIYRINTILNLKKNDNSKQATYSISAMELKIGDNKIKLTGQEDLIFQTLLNKKQEITSKRELLEKLNKPLNPENLLNINVTILRLRARISKVLGKNSIKTIRNNGYILTYEQIKTIQ